MFNLPIIRRSIIGVGLILLLWWWFSLPGELFDDDYSTVLTDADGQLLGALIASDGQWRFPEVDTLPETFVQALLTFEDERFYYHPGVDPIAIARAVVGNLKAGHVVSGASTISMQVIRMHRNRSSRSIGDKFLEALLALRLELRYSKEEILALWASHAPFGGNVVGISAASWRYFHRPLDDLSWAEAATLAILPNAPNLIHPGKNRDALHAKRDRLLHRMHEAGVIDEATLSLAQLEHIPERPYPIANLTPHLLQTLRLQGYGGQQLRTTIQVPLQNAVNHIVTSHHLRLKDNDIHNAAAIVVRLSDQKVVAYVGNTPAGADHGASVDIIHRPRSSGSILKPFLYAAQMQSGTLMPKELVADIPTIINGYRPINFYDRYDGAVPADEALARSLNIPAVRSLQDYGVPNFHLLLREIGLSTITRSPDEYGLSLILGGAEVTLWDLAQAYTGMAVSLNHYHDRYGQYDSRDWSSLSVFVDEPSDTTHSNSTPIDAAAAWLTFKALTKVERPLSESGWDMMEGRAHWSWKTGTSIGHRDAWAVGVTPDYLVAVWVGNATGEGRPQLTGLQAAAPILFQIAEHLPVNRQFEPPYDELTQMVMCSQSGMRAGSACTDTIRSYVHHHASRSLPCAFHSSVITDVEGRYRVYRDCAEDGAIAERTQFVLPPAQAYYYRQMHPDYIGPLPWKPDCQNAQRAMEVIYPHAGSRIKIPVDYTGKVQAIVIETAHQDPDATLYWHIDEEFIGTTHQEHIMPVNLPAGPHHLTVVDSEGGQVSRDFVVVN